MLPVWQHLVALSSLADCASAQHSKRLERRMGNHAILEIGCQTDQVSSINQWTRL